MKVGTQVLRGLRPGRKHKKLIQLLERPSTSQFSMGGGDLNLKKSWDPRRLDNKEEKWKREEQDKSERRKMKELLAERTTEQSMEEMRRQGEDAGVLEKRKDRVDWMYKGPEAHTNPDDYLLGKKVDKDIVKAQSGHSQTSEGGLASTSSILGGSANSALDAKDMARKMREDPLFAIKKRELNNRKELVNNPIRMKQLQQMLQTQVGKDKKKSKKAKRHKEKKEKKHKKPALPSDDSSSEDNVAPSHSRKRHQNGQRSADKSRMKNRKGQSSRRLETSSDSSGESESDNAKPGRGGKRTMTSLDPARIKKLLEQEMLKKQSRHERVSDSSSRESDSDEHRRNKPSRQPGRENFKVEQKHRYMYESREHERNQKERKPEEGISPRKSKRRSFSEEEGSPVKYGLQKRARSLRLETPLPQRKDHSRHHQRTERRRGKSPYEDDRPSQKSQHGCRENRSQSPQPRHGDILSDRQGDKYRGERNRSRSPRKQSADKYKRSRSRSPSRQTGGPKGATAKRKLTAEEMERKRAEMMDNAKWRDDQRKKRVKIYEKEEKAEAEMEKKKAKNAEFVQPLKLPDNSSVEDRIHRNIYNIQRTNAALDKNFAKR